MACNVVPGTEDPAKTGNNTGDTSSCSTSCWNGGESINDTDNDHINYNCKEGGACRNGAHGCGNNCQGLCSTCSNQCGNDCYGGCSEQCVSCTDDCSPGCRTACSSSCTGCRGECEGQCQGTCKNACNQGCKTVEQIENAKIQLERIVNVDNVKKIFRFVLGEAKRRKISIDASIFDKIGADAPILASGENWSTEDVEKFYVLFYNIPRIFEDTLKTMNENVPIQSGTLKDILNDGNYIPYIDNNSEEFKYYADRSSALEWLKAAMRLYDATVPIMDGK